MHVYLREEQVQLRMETVDAEGLVPEGSDLVPMAFFADDNAAPSFRALLPPHTVEILRDALVRPVTLGLLAEEPEGAAEEIRAMVGLAVPIEKAEMFEVEGEEEEEDEPWKASVGSGEEWRGEEAELEEGGPRAALLAFAPLVRLQRRFPDDFGEELADLLETALAGSTRPSLQARIDQMLGDM